MKKNRSPSGMICAKGAMGGMGGGGASVSSEQSFSNKMHSFSCQISVGSFDEVDFVASLKADVEQEINLSGATIVNQGSSEPVGFYFEYSEGNILGRINIDSVLLNLWGGCTFFRFWLLCLLTGTLEIISSSLQCLPSSGLSLDWRCRSLSRDFARDSLKCKADLSDAAETPRWAARQTIMTDDEFEAFVDTAYEELREKQDLLMEGYRLGTFSRWWFEQPTEKLQFFDEADILRSARVGRSLR
ncbi:MAG: hypothetical protein ACRD8U_07130 [Pyrinomonadaceae bacterium]